LPLSVIGARIGRASQDYQAFKTQRSRWAGGAVKKHWRKFLPGASRLDHDQKREFVFGWLNWFGAEIIGVAAALLNPIWVPFVAFKIVAIPDPLLTLPIFSAFLVSLIHFACSYRLRVAVPYRQMLGAMVVFMSVQWTVASAAFKAASRAQQLFPSHLQGQGRRGQHPLDGDAGNVARRTAGSWQHHNFRNKFLPGARG
jgi:hypothetical protein